MQNTLASHGSVNIFILFFMSSVAHLRNFRRVAKQRRFKYEETINQFSMFPYLLTEIVISAFSNTEQRIIECFGLAGTFSG